LTRTGRFRGQYVQSQNDIFPNAVAGRPWAPSPGEPTPPAPMLYWDRVSYSGWAFDLHNPKGMLDPDHPPFVATITPYMFSTPLRSLVSKDVSNLFFAGRLASFSHVVYGSQRVMRTCSTMGQAVGTAAAYAVSHGLAPIELQDHRDAVWSIQQQLLRDDAFIIGVLNEDPRDLARTSTVTATSETDSGDLDGRASNVISGQSRAVTGDKGVAPGQGLNGTNRWISTALPAALTLQLATPQAVAQVQLVFDTGMHRKLNFNPVGSPGDALHWSPQPETVRDYVIEGRTTDGWVPLCNVTGNYLRRRVHSLPCASEPGPGPAPAPAPPAVAPGALVADLCTADAGQMWTIDHTGEVSTIVGTNKFCLGYSSNLAAFGGAGRAVVALPCGQGSNITAWSLKPSAANGTGAFLQAVPDVPCFSASKAACNASKASSVAIAGAGDAGFNGLYVKDEKRGTSDGFPVFTKDAAHYLHRYGGMWHLASMGSSVSCKRHWPAVLLAYPHLSAVVTAIAVPVKAPWHRGRPCCTPSGCSTTHRALTLPPRSPSFCTSTADTATTKGLDGPPVPSGWQVTGPGIAPAPRSVTCQAVGPDPRGSCRCVHAVACAACHSEEYFPGTAVELTDCTADVTHIRWLQLKVSGGDSTRAMLMSGGLCLGVPTAAPGPASTDGTGPVVRPISDRAGAVSPPAVLSEIRVTVSATNGFDFAVINEVRLYDERGTSPFPVRPQ